MRVRKKMNKWLEEKPRKLRKEFLSEYKNFHDIDVSKAEFLIKEAIDYYTGKINHSPYASELEWRWYESNDFTVYSDEYYFTDLWACWHLYSRGYLRAIKKTIFDRLQNVESIIDLGCGIGYTTSALKGMFPNAKVYATNIEDSPQYNFCKMMSEKNGFLMIPSAKKLNHTVDLVFGSEYFEHIKEPISHALSIIKYLEPKFLLIANSFNTFSVGHFEKYEHNKKEIDQSKISKMFNQALRDNGYKKVKTNLWNNKPALWVGKV